MCELRACQGVLALAAAGMLGWPLGGAAQSVEDSLARRVRDLEGLYRAAEFAVVAADSARDVRARAGGEPQDTVRVGPMRIVTTRDQVDEARRLWEQEWRTFEPIVGGSARLLDSVTFVYHRRPTPYPYQLSAPQVRVVENRARVSDLAMRGAISATLGAAVADLLPPDLARWSGRLPLGAPTVPTVLYRRFVQAPASVAQLCARGALESCWLALGQMDSSADPIAAWYAPEEQRALATRMAPNPTSTLIRAECARGVQESCREMLGRDLGPGTAMPYPPAVRSHLLWFALERGGAGSLDRLLASPDAQPTPEPDETETIGNDVLAGSPRIKEYLGAAAGMDPDELLRQWLDEILAGHPGPPAPDLPAGANVVLWLAALAAFATRSTRWR